MKAGLRVKSGELEDGLRIAGAPRTKTNHRGEAKSTEKKDKIGNWLLVIRQRREIEVADVCLPAFFLSPRSSLLRGDSFSAQAET
jgi:hypothetical protein